jgi:transcription elongation factor GreA
MRPVQQVKNYISEEKKKELEKELENLKGPKRKEILDNLKYAKSLGDLSENAEYHQARENQSHLETRIQKVEQILRSSTIISGSLGDGINVGSSVKVQRLSGNKKEDAPTGSEETYTIVGSEEADVSLKKISDQSLLGKVLLGKEIGEVVSFKTPNGQEVNYKIISFS